MQTTDHTNEAFGWQLLKKGGTPGAVTTDWAKRAEFDSHNRIRCPKCEWVPESSSRWTCWSGDGPEPPFTSCGTSWNTFTTRGKCPGCAHQWKWTSCLQCHGWSLHEDWYEFVQNDL